MQIDTLTLRPDPGRAAGWSLLSAALIAFGIWFVVDSGGAPFMWIVLAVGIAVSTYFVLQLVAPGWFLVTVGPEGIRARTVWQHLDITWDRVESASIREFAGEPYLRIGVIQQHAHGWVVLPTALLLPLGSDIGALRMALARARAVGRMGMETTQDAA